MSCDADVDFRRSFVLAACCYQGRPLGLNTVTRRFKEIGASYATLSDPEKKAFYDRW